MDQLAPPAEKISEEQDPSDDSIVDHASHKEYDPPQHADLRLIGMKAIFQVFPRKGEGEIDSSQMDKYYGIVEALVLMPDQFIFKLHGCDAIACKYDEEYVEIFPETWFE